MTIEILFYMEEYSSATESIPNLILAHVPSFCRLEIFALAFSIFVNSIRNGLKQSKFPALTFFARLFTRREEKVTHKINVTKIINNFISKHALAVLTL
jgi:hypothetical protein